jgi:endonuclease/exonuclease/phosphatase family metal-dependent hydrolase
MTRRLRRLAGGAAAVLALTGVLGSVSAGTAAAGPLAAPSSTVAFGDRTLTVAWRHVTGATGYRVQYSTGSSFAGARTIDAGTRSWIQIKGLANGTRYYERVVAVGGGAAATGGAHSAVPDDGYPRELAVTAAPAGRDAIRVSWTGQGRATKVGVIAASEGSLSKQVFRSSWYPPTTTSITLPVPAALRAQLGTGSGNPIFVKVAVYNSATAGTSMSNVKDEAAAYRLSPAGTYTWAGSLTPTGSRLRVAEWNVNSVTASAGLSGHTWLDRRKKVAAGIAYSGAAVVATAELTTADAGLGTGVRQWEDLRNLLAQSAYGGYSVANSVTPATTGGAANTTVGAHLFYKASVVTREAGGFVSPRTQLGLTWPANLTDRYFSWARFRVNATGAEFYAVAVHLPADSGSTSYTALRKQEIAAIDSYVSARAGGLPVLVMGDFNSSFAETPAGPDGVLTGRGYYDASATTSRANARISTANITHQVDNLAVRGYPTTPYVYRYPAPRIDYILVKNAPGSSRYGNQVVLANGRFDTRYQGSDHNLQWADIGIPKR